MHIDQQVDLLEYLYAILRAKYRILILAILVAGGVFGLSKMVANKYTATAVLAVNINENPGGVAPKTYRGSDALGLLEHDFIIDAAPANELDRLLARLRSSAFVTHFIEQKDLLPALFPNLWDAQAEQWIEKSPDMREAVALFKASFLGINHDESNGLLFVSFTTHDPVFSADLANEYTEVFNVYLREAQLKELKSRRAYLEQRLGEVQNIEVHRSIYRLLESQLAVESLLYARNNYPLEKIQPATIPLFKSYPARKQWTVLAFFGVVFLGIFCVIAWVIFKKIRASLAAYAPPKPVIEDVKATKSRFSEFKAKSSRDEWID